jgi:hypothetical protein
MQKLVLLIVGAAWLVVLVPPMLRSRGENRPTSSVDHFRRNLAVLQQSAPPRINPLQSMARPLAGSRQGLTDAYSRAAMRRNPTDPRLRRSDVSLARRSDVAGVSGARRNSEDMTAPLERRSETRAISRHQVMKQRREKTVRLLLTLSVGTAILAFLAKSPGLIYVCAICVLSLFAYCAKLLRLRREAELYAAQGYSRAA